MNITIREENTSDVQPIFELTKAAFADCPHGGHTEQFIVNALRKAGALSISLLAEADGKVVGHIAFSPATISDGSGGWYGLGPISVLPQLQRQGIGSSLMNEGLSRLKTLRAKGCVLVGEPAYYHRFGFRSLAELTVAGVPQQYVLALPLGREIPRGSVSFHEAFGAKS